MKNKVNVEELKGKKTMAAPGVWAYDAEEKVVNAEGETVYVHVNDYGDFLQFTVGKESLFIEEAAEEQTEEMDTPFVGDADFEEKMEALCGGVSDAETLYTEAYSGISKTKDSQYHDVFVVLDAMISLMESGRA